MVNLILIRPGFRQITLVTDISNAKELLLILGSSELVFDVVRCIDMNTGFDHCGTGGAFYDIRNSCMRLVK